jgi:Holliday junction resolvase RusA-like endonuclease
MPYTHSLHVPYRPTAQKRHRHTREGRTYDPCCLEKKAFLRLCVQDSAPNPAYFSGPLACMLRFTFARPRSHCTGAGVLRKGSPLVHVFKPDVDNLAKFVMDALSGVYYRDDRQITYLCVEKKYGDEDSVAVDLKWG